MNPDVSFLIEPIIIWVIGVAVGLLLLYGVIRAGVAGGLRDHEKWMHKDRIGGDTNHRLLGAGYPPITPASELGDSQRPAKAERTAFADSATTEPVETAE